MTRPLPQIDLVRVMPLDRIEKKKALERIKFFRPTLTYAPVRASNGDLMNMQPGMFEAVPASWDQVQFDITKKSKHEDEKNTNLVVAKLLFDDTKLKNRTSFHQEFFPLKIGMNAGVTLWNNLYYIENSTPIFPFIDPRRNQGLNSNARDVAFSLMHQRIRVDGSDFENAQFAIYQFPHFGKDERHLKLHTSEKAQLYSYEQLEQMIVEVYQLWEEVLAEREHEKRKTAGGSRGSLL